MTAISKSYVAVADGSVDPDSPADTVLFTALRDDVVFLMEWLGYSYQAGAVRDHNHDGVNSAGIEIGPNMLRNGTFESGLNGWTTALYSGGAAAVGPTGAQDGANALAITSTVLANGGAVATSNEYVPVDGNATYSLVALLYASVAGVSAQVNVKWYDAAKALISSTGVYATASAPTTAAPVGGEVVAPANARFAKAELIGGVPATGTAVGTVYFDGVLLYSARERVVGGTASTVLLGTLVDSTLFTVSLSTYAELANAKVMCAGTLRIQAYNAFVGGNPTTTLRIYKNGVAYGTETAWNNSITDGVLVYDETLEFAEGDTVQMFAKSSSGAGSIKKLTFSTAAPIIQVMPYYVGQR